MTLFVYGNRYEGGGFLFYTLSNILFSCLYLIILVVAGSLSTHGTNAAAVTFLVPLLAVTISVHRRIQNTFVEPSMTLSLARARAFDEQNEQRTTFPKKNIGPHMESMNMKILTQVAAAAEENATNWERSDSNLSFSDDDSRSQDTALSEYELRRIASERMQSRYPEERVNGASGMIDSEWSSDAPPDYFVYRQPSLDRETWESSPQPYRKQIMRRRRDPVTAGDADESVDSFPVERMDV